MTVIDLENLIENSDLAEWPGMDLVRAEAAIYRFKREIRTQIMVNNGYISVAEYRKLYEFDINHPIYNADGKFIGTFHNFDDNGDVLVLEYQEIFPIFEQQSYAQVTKLTIKKINE